MSFYTGSFNYLLIRHLSFGARGTPDMQMQNLVTLSEKVVLFCFFVVSFALKGTSIVQKSSELLIQYSQSVSIYVQD